MSEKNKCAKCRIYLILHGILIKSAEISFFLTKTSLACYLETRSADQATRQTTNPLTAFSKTLCKI